MTLLKRSPHPLSVLILCGAVIGVCGLLVSGRAIHTSIPKLLGWRPSPHPKVRRTGVAIAPHSLIFVQKGLHNCGSISMLEAWARLNPGPRSRLVYRQKDGSYRVYFAGAGVVNVQHADLAAAEKFRVVEPRPGDPWAEVVLVAFARSLRPGGTLSLGSTEWVDAGKMGQLLTTASPRALYFKPDLRAPESLAAGTNPISLDKMDVTFKATRDHPAVLYTNHLIHIWSVEAYDPAHRRVRARNPRRTSAEWVALPDLRTRFEMVEWMESGR